MLAMLSAFVWLTEPAQTSYDLVTAVPARNDTTSNLPEARPIATGLEAVPTDKPATPEHARLRQAITTGLADEEIAALLASLDDAEVLAMFNETYMDLRWMQEHGIDAAARRRLAALWLSNGPSAATAPVEGTIGFRGGSSVAVAAPAVFNAEERYVHADFARPPGYRGDAIIVRWVDLDSRSVVSVDRHPIGAAAAQEVWMRAAQDWKPGRYRVEVFGADAGLQPLAAASFTVQTGATQ
jgi:hypothetical protein